MAGDRHCQTTTICAWTSSRNRMLQGLWVQGTTGSATAPFRAFYNLAACFMIEENCPSVTPAPIAAVLDTPPVAVMSSASASSAPDHCGRAWGISLAPRRTSFQRMTHLLVGQDVAANVPLAPLDQLDVRLHALLGKGLGEQVADVRVRVQAGELGWGSRRSAYAFAARLRQRRTVINCQIKPSFPSLFRQSSRQ